MDFFLAMLLVWLLHAGIALALSAPIIFLGRRRVRWRHWELLALVLPFTVWLLLMFSPLSAGQKSLSNLGEPFYFSLAVPLATLVRVGVGRRIGERAVAFSLIVALCGIAAATFFMMPALPE